MTSLVAYDDSGSDISDSDEEQIHENHSNKKQDSKEDNKDSMNLFQTLPTPKASDIKKNIVEEEDDEFLHKKETPSEVPTNIIPVVKDPVKKTTKIFLPSLSSFNDEEDEVRPVTKFKQSSKGTGLLNLLPKPRLTQLSEQTKNVSSTSLVPDSVKTKKVASTSLVPDSVKNKINKAPVPSTTVSKVDKKKALPIAKYDSSGESDEENEDIDFFSLNKEPEALPILDVHSIENIESIHRPTPPNVVQDTRIPEYIPVQDINYEENMDVEVPQTYEAVQSSSLDINSEAFKKLAGSRAKRKGEVVQIIDIDQKEIMPDPREWLTKALTEDTSKRSSASKRRGDEPTNQQKKKHQITYLAHQAKANEQELQNQWANNRLSKRQTQSKYGF